MAALPDWPRARVIDYSDLFGRSPNPYMVIDREFRFVAMNEAYLRVTARTREELLGVCVFDAFPGDPSEPDDSNVRELRLSLQRVFDTGQAQTLSLIRYAIPMIQPDGTVAFEERFWSATHTPLPGPAGEVRHVLQHTVDVTELQRLKAELHQARQARQDLCTEQIENGVFQRARKVQLDNQTLESQRRHLLRLFDEAPGFMAYLSGPEHVYELVNAAYLQMIGNRDVIGMPIRIALPEIDGQGYYELLDQVYRTGKPFVGTGAEVEIEHDGVRTTVYVDFVYQPVFDSQGTVTGILVQGHDITSQKLAQSELEHYRRQLEDLVQARTRALERSEAALVHARKLEDIGKLTGGVAHDFNNVLQIIGANLQLLASRRDLPGTLQRYAHAAMQGVERGARLASQLLAFARRQPLQPVVLDLGAHLAQMETLLHGTLGEAIQLQLRIVPGLCNIEADPHQLDNALLNLAINARDAMQGRGHLRVSARTVTIREGEEELPAGDYALLRIADNGCGMPAEVLAQAFEPFFTTKEVGQGTGLGLSMVYGFVKQSGGHVSIHSKPDAGTEVRIWLPRSAGKPPVSGAPSARPVMGGHETVLLVEDDVAVRTSAVTMVAALGYQVHAAAGGEEALSLLQRGIQADLLFTDVVMPGPVSGIELARRARMLRPGIAVLFTSGYAQNALAHDGRLDIDVHLLAKPYRREELARKLREVLDRPRRGATWAGLRVLVVEDQADNHIATLALLRVLGHVAHGVVCVEEAITALEAAQWDVVLTDLHLRGVSGTTLIGQVRMRWPQVRVVVASGASFDELHALQGVDAILHKPYGVEQLWAALTGSPAPADGARAQAGA